MNDIITLVLVFIIMIFIVNAFIIKLNEFTTPIAYRTEKSINDTYF